jgi:hypothetical protein
MRASTAPACIVLVAAVLSCNPPAPTPPPAPTDIANAELGIRLATLPEGLTVAVNQGATLELRPLDPAAGGAIRFFAGPEEHGVNLVAAVQEHQRRIESLPDGAYLGAQELQAEFGTAFYSRGRFSDEGAAVEETIIVLIHPAGGRRLTLVSTYPAAEDSAARVEQLIDVLGYLE